MKYPFIEEIDANTSHGKILERITPGSVVLECGCASGYMTRYMKEKLNCSVFIVEYDREAFEHAIQFASDGVCGDLMSDAWSERFATITFDYIIFGDVLEHLTQPLRVLKRAVSMMKEDGTVLVSLPNIGHNDILAKLWDGRWDYTSTGLLDDTHVHFWGMHNLDPFFEEAGLRVTYKDYIQIKTLQTEQFENGDHPKGGIPSQQLEQRAFGEVYQFILAAQKKTFVNSNNVVVEDKLAEYSSNAVYIYFDRGNGFSEDDKLKLTDNAKSNNALSAFLKLEKEKSVRRIRFDPCDFPARIQLTAIDDRGNVCDIKPANANFAENGMACFMHGDPFYELELDPDRMPLSIEITGKYIRCSQGEIDRFYAGQVQRTNTEITKLSEKVVTMETNIQNLSDQLTTANAQKEYTRTQLETRTLQLTDTRAQLEEVNSELTDTKAQLEEVNSELTDTKAQLEGVNSELTDTKAQLESVYSELADARAQLQNMGIQLAGTNAQYAELSATFASVINSHSWNLTKPLRFVFEKGRWLVYKFRTLWHLSKKAMVVLKREGFRGLWSKISQYRQKLKNPGLQIEAASGLLYRELNYRENIAEPVDMPLEWVDIQKKQLLISVIMAIRKAEIRGYAVTRALDSLVQQKYRNLELVLVCPEQESTLARELVCGYEDKLNIRLYTQEDSENQKEFWDTAVKQASGELIVLMEQEDVLTPNALAYVLEVANESPNVELIVIPDDRFFEDGEYMMPDHKTGMRWDVGGTETLLHMGVYRNYGKTFADGQMEAWIKGLDKNTQIVVLPWVGCHGEAVESVWNDGDRVRCLAFYLPQFHAIPENDEWWGKGFTEWVNVRKAEPLYPGHDQPRIPTELGYYDLGEESAGVEVLQKQMELAKEHGVDGFCYYYYWFDDGRRLLEKPLDRHLDHKELDLPFCLCWANENWTRRWDGQVNDVLMPQTYKDGWAEQFILDILPYIQDERYIRVNGAPYIMIYNIQDIPDAGEAINTWRRIAAEHGIERLHISAVRRTVEASEFTHANHALDSLTDFPPHLLNLINIDHDEPERFGLTPGQIKDYRKASRFHIHMGKQDYTYFRTPILAWDNTARKGKNAYIFENFSFEEYQKWLYSCKRYTLRQNRPGENLVFINAWNEWAEGTYLEPSAPNDRAALEATRKALNMR